MNMRIDFTCCHGSLPRTNGVLNLTSSEALDYLSKGALLVDIREAYETNFRVFDVAEVLYLPWTRFAASFIHLPHDRALIIADAAGIYCREAARMLTEAGYTNIAKLSGGMIDWDAEGFPVRKDTSYELSGQCACKLKTRVGTNPLITKQQSGRSSGDSPTMAD